MKTLSLLLMLVSSCAIAQKQTPTYYLYTKDWNVANNVETADYIIQTTNIGDSLFVNRIFKGRGVLWKQESFNNAEQSVPHGCFAWYDDKGRIDSIGYVDNRLKHGNWTYYDDTLGIYLSLRFEKGREVERRDYLTRIIQTPTGEKTFDQEKQEKDSLKKNVPGDRPDEKEAAFKGGPKGYQKYLMEKLVPPADIQETGTVKMQFIINKEGIIEDLHVLRSLQLSVDIEALRVLSEMPKWTPAFQNGRNVYYQCIQHITFQAN